MVEFSPWDQQNLGPETARLLDRAIAGGRVDHEDAGAERRAQERGQAVPEVIPCPMGDDRHADRGR
jgi:hypothetical protein